MTSLFARALVPLACLAAGCQALGGGGARDDGRGAALDLERLQVGSVYGVGSRFAADGIELAVESFGAGAGNAEIAQPEPAPREASAGAAEKGADAPKTLVLSHALLACRGQRATHLEFDFVDRGGSVALEIGGERRTAADFIALDGQELGTARLSVTESSTAGVRRGRVVVEGAFEGFAIGGAELVLADVRLARD